MDFVYDSRRHSIEFHSENASIAKVYLSIDQLWGKDNSLLKKSDFFLPVCVIKAGQASLALFHNSELIDHKVFRAYMVRKKQGKSQVKHLKTKGKSRLGSRIRLSETERFFEEINKRLNKYNKHPIEKWALSCSKTLWPFLFESDVTPPFESKSESIYKIPFHISEAKFEIQDKLYHELCSMHISTSEVGKKLLSPLLESSPQNDEDW